MTRRISPFFGTLTLAFFLVMPFVPAKAHTLFMADGSKRRCADIVMQKKSLICLPSNRATPEQGQTIPLERIRKIRYDNQITIPVVPSAIGPEKRTQADLLEPEHHLHNGFFLRYSPKIGGHYSRYSLSDSPSLPSWQQRGGGLAHQISIGGAIDWDQILYLEALLQNKNELFYYDRKPQAEPAWQKRLRLGLGYNHYLNMHNYYIAASLGLEQWTFSHGQLGTQQSQAFYYSEINFGREWWLSANWAMGLGLFASAAWTQGDGYHLSYGLAATATYN